MGCMYAGASLGPAQGQLSLNKSETKNKKKSKTTEVLFNLNQWP